MDPAAFAQLSCARSDNCIPPHCASLTAPCCRLCCCLLVPMPPSPGIPAAALVPFPFLADLMVDPVVSKCGHDFCKFCLEMVFNASRRNYKTPSCPVCRTTLGHFGVNQPDLSKCQHSFDQIQLVYPVCCGHCLPLSNTQLWLLSPATAAWSLDYQHSNILPLASYIGC